MTRPDERDHEPVRTQYDPGGDDALSYRIVEAIEEHQNRDLSRSEFVLYDDINPDSLDDLFRENSSSNTTVQFDTDGVTVSLWGDGTVEILVTERDESTRG